MIDTDMIKALRCIASQDAEGNCYEDIYNFRKEENMERLPERLREYAAAYERPPYGREVFGTVELLREAASALESGWIPVEERLPEEGKYILVSFENFSVADIARYETDENGGAFYPGDEDKSYVSFGLFVNAWMPLPEPYRPEK